MTYEGFFPSQQNEGPMPTSTLKDCRNRVCGHFRDYAEGSTQISITQISRLYEDRNKTGKAVQPSQSCRLEQKRVRLEIRGTATSLPLAGRRVFVEGVHQRSHVTYNLSSKKIRDFYKLTEKWMEVWKVATRRYTCSSSGWARKATLAK